MLQVEWLPLSDSGVCDASPLPPIHGFTTTIANDDHWLPAQTSMHVTALSLTPCSILPILIAAVSYSPAGAVCTSVPGL